MPLHVWLPGAHAAAPSHVSALMSGVLIKMGIYGLVRDRRAAARAAARWWGVACSSLGAVSGVLGVAFALGQHDLKRLLAYHSIENIGIIAARPRPRAARPRARAARAGSLLGPRRRAAARLEPRALQGAALPRRRLRRPRDRHAARSTSWRPRARACRATARALPRRRGRDLRPAAAQRLRQRAARSTSASSAPRARAPGARAGAGAARRRRSRSIGALARRLLREGRSAPSSSASRARRRAATAHEAPAAHARADGACSPPPASRIGARARRSSRPLLDARRRARWTARPRRRRAARRRSRRFGWISARRVALRRSRSAARAAPCAALAGARGRAAAADLGLRLRRARRARMQYTASSFARDRRRRSSAGRCGPRVDAPALDGLFPRAARASTATCPTPCSTGSSLPRVARRARACGARCACFQHGQHAASTSSTSSSRRRCRCSSWRDAVGGR